MKIKKVKTNKCNASMSKLWTSFEYLSLIILGCGEDINTTEE